MIVITGIRDIHLNSIREDAGNGLARNLAHVYHFYLFGDRGRSGNMKLPSIGNSKVPVSITQQDTASDRSNITENSEQNAFAREPQTCRKLEIHDKMNSRLYLEFILCISSFGRVCGSRANVF